MSKNQELSRAERVRQRRKKQRYENIAEMPIHEPVQPFRPSKEKSFIGPKKRKTKTYNLDVPTVAKPREALKVPTVEFQMPNLEWRAVSGFFTVLLALALYFMWTSPTFLVAVPNVDGSEYLAKEQIVETLDLGGKPIFMLQPEKLARELLLAHPSLKTVEITISLPNVVSVTVTDRQPILIWRQDGKMAWIDEEGIAFQANGEAGGLITVNALGRPPAPAIDAATRNPWAPPAYLDPNVVAALRALLPYVPQGASITYDPSVGLGWQDPRGWMVELGDMTEDFGLKLRLYETISNWLVANNIQPVLVNVAYPHAPYYRTER